MIEALQPLAKNLKAVLVRGNGGVPVPAAGSPAASEGADFVLRTLLAGPLPPREQFPGTDRGHGGGGGGRKRGGGGGNADYYDDHDFDGGDESGEQDADVFRRRQRRKLEEAQPSA